MSLAVWKFALPITDNVVVEMPSGAQVLHVGEQGAEVFLWALVDPSLPVEERRFRVAGTGHQLYAAEASKHVGTTVAHGGALVWHVFEVSW